MIRFNKIGMRVFPFPQEGNIDEEFDLLVIENCFCPNGHSLISHKVDFNGFKGIALKIQKEEEDGLVAFSPIWGDKSRFVLDIEIKHGEIMDFMCPECGVTLPIKNTCPCGATYVILYANEHANISDSVNFCNRAGCYEAFINKGGIKLSYISSQIKWR